MNTTQITQEQLNIEDAERFAALRAALIAAGPGQSYNAREADAAATIEARRKLALRIRQWSKAGLGHNEDPRIDNAARVYLGAAY